MDLACCTCATLLSAVPAVLPCSPEASTEKPLLAPSNRRLECCARVICGHCQDKNPRFRSYCPYCQLPSSSSRPPPVLESRGRRSSPRDQLPSYYAAVTANPASASPSPPPYTPFAAPPPPAAAAPDPRPTDPTSTSPSPSPSLSPSPGKPEALTPPAHPAPRHISSPIPSDPEKAAAAAAAATLAPDEEGVQDTLHFLDHADDTVTSLSLRYGVPAVALRRANNLASDHLLAARRTILIPATHYPHGVSLSPRPVEGEEEEARKAKIRRWMVACKVADYEVAVLYLEQADYDFQDAVDAYLADEAWERDHPLDRSGGRDGNPSRIGRLVSGKMSQRRSG
ncbi:hypothetical protein QBC47DRAFT_390691 [Echria macrotheca]|uniref:LysM domain-containing protein n=1 Tax=Echria macrotheca TaxID=438768 RepID=A0AAJ0B4U1_9PEZI|nr:hypothetical protein QBC47DRAFT_390691 [Echria macrotheca]